MPMYGTTDLSRNSAVVDVTATAPLGQAAAKVQVVTLLGADGTNPVSGTNPAYVGFTASTVGAQTQVASNTSSVTLLSANAARRGAGLYYDAAAVLYVLVGTNPASASTANFTVKMGQGLLTYYEVPAGYTGIIRGLWSVATGSVNVTEYT